MLLKFLTRYRDAGLLILRLGLGAFFVMHGAPKLMGGPKVWEGLGKSMANVGIDVFPVFWGFMAAFSECFGGFFLVIGMFFRPAVILLAIVMTVASFKHIQEMPKKDQWDFFMRVASRPMELAVVFYSLILIGPGRFSVDKE